jgi:uncharacterized membrane protein
MTKAESFFTKKELEEIVEAIANAEEQTSGEIRLYIEDGSKDEPLDRAAFIFEQLDMHTTKLRNGVLFYLAIAHKKFAILGDAGIHKVVHETFWDEIKLHILNHFKHGKYKEGLCEGIHMAGEALKVNFPYQKDDKNELPNDIVFGPN